MKAIAVCLVVLAAVVLVTPDTATVERPYQQARQSYEQAKAHADRRADIYRDIAERARRRCRGRAHEAKGGTP